MRQRKRRKKNPVLRITLLLVILIALVAGGFLIYINSASKALDPSDTEQVLVMVPSGSSTGSIADLLESNGLIDNTTVFKLQSRLKGYDGQYKVGGYALSKSMSMQEMMEKIISGGSETKRFTVPEGYTVQQTGESLANEGFVDINLFMQEVQSGQFDYDFLDGLEMTENRLEGYLYPETYDVYVTANEHDVIDRMLKQFDSLFTEEHYSKAKELGLTVNEVVTLASLIERETKVPEERAMVASVIFNRLKIGMKLQIDATVQYALGEQKDRLLYKDLEIDSPYNTYKIDGIPPGPICSPRIECIDAVLNPADTDYIYYVLKPEMNGSHNFATNATDFQRYKDQYINAL